MRRILVATLVLAFGVSARAVADGEAAERGPTALHEAVRAHSEAVAAKLLAGGADPNAVWADYYGATPSFRWPRPMD